MIKLRSFAFCENVITSAAKASTATAAFAQNTLTVWPNKRGVLKALMSFVSTVQWEIRFDPEFNGGLYGKD